ncbi:MAG: hypothetical protein ACRC0X_06400 [Brevinema sp.]
MNKEKDYLYQDLPSIKPRISREERLLQRRQTPCIDCQPHGIEKAKQSFKHLYFFYLAVLAMGFVTIQIYQKINAPAQIIENSRQILFSLSQKAHISIIEQPNRYGISILFRNNSKNKPWNIQNFTISLKNSDTVLTNLVLDRNITGSYSLFIPLEQKINNLNNIDLIINP